MQRDHHPASRPLQEVRVCELLATQVFRNWGKKLDDNALRWTYAAGFITNSLPFKKSTFKVAGTIPRTWWVIMFTLVTWVITLSSGIPRRKSRITLTVCSDALSHVNRCVSLGFQVAWSCRWFVSQGPRKCTIVRRGLEADCWSHWIHSAVEIVLEVCNDAIFFYKMWKLKKT